MKRFIKNIILFSVCLFVILELICVLIDPFNVFHVNRIRDTGVEPEKNYIKMTYVLDNPGKFDSFLFGSSRVDSTHIENIPDGHYYNMSYPDGLLTEFRDNLKTMLKNGIVPQNVIISLDYSSYLASPKEHEESTYSVPYEYSKENPVRFFARYLDPSVVGNAIVSTMIDKGETIADYSSHFYEYGWTFDYGYKGYFAPSNTREEAVDEYYRTNSIISAQDLEDRMPVAESEDALEAVREIVEICSEYGIEYKFYTHPTRYAFYSVGAEQFKYLSFLKQLAEITPFYNFSGYNSFTTNPENYYDSSHYNAEAADILIDCMFNGTVDENMLRQGFGMYVTNDNVDELIGLLTSDEPLF